jgi:hypothetical protein
MKYISRLSRRCPHLAPYAAARKSYEARSTVNKVISVCCWLTSLQRGFESFVYV